ncbi:hypothetical protein F5Y11DRAFT_363242 [Daldinia sp. FL1419]|nr:hypothetical protein F5Y11DRAFT_363242 [Daldinia sp. FL1419]
MEANKDSMEISRVPPAVVQGSKDYLDFKHPQLEFFPEFVEPATPRTNSWGHRRARHAPLATPASPMFHPGQKDLGQDQGEGEGEDESKSDGEGDGEGERDGEGEGEGEGEDEGNANLPAGSRFSAKVQYINDVWVDLKRRVTPQQYPHAWLLFLGIITIAAGAIIAGWCSLAAETVHHLEMMGAASITSVARFPVTADLKLARGFDAAGVETDVLATEFVEAVMTTMTTGVDGAGIVSDVLAGSIPTAELAAKTAVAKDLVTTVTVTVAGPPELASNEDKGTAATSALGQGTISTMATITAPAPALSGETTSTSTEPRVLCPNTDGPLVWTPCHRHRISATSSAVVNPFSVIRRVLGALWEALAG